MSFFRLAAIATAVGLAGCVHTPAGTSVEVALAKKAALVRMPAPANTPPGPAGGGSQVTAVEPALPEGGAVVERVGEAYSRGTFCVEAGRDAEAIEAFREVVKLDPTFSDAWHNLAMLYEKAGDEKKAIEAFKKAKKIARQ